MMTVKHIPLAFWHKGLFHCLLYDVWRDATVPVAAATSEFNCRALHFLLWRAVVTRYRSWEEDVIRLWPFPSLLTTIPEFWNCFHSIETAVFKYSHFSLLLWLSALPLNGWWFATWQILPNDTSEPYQSVFSPYTLKSNAVSCKFHSDIHFWFTVGWRNTLICMSETVWSLLSG